MQLSKLESDAYEELKKNKIKLFRIADLCLLLKIDKTAAYNLVKALKKKSAIKMAGKGFFSVGDADEFEIGTRISSPSYISFWSALSYYGFSDQMPKKVFIATTKYCRDINNFKYITLSKKRFFGYVSIGEIVIAEREKAIIDSLLFPKYSGGIKEVIKCMKAALGQIDIEKLIDYALKTESNAVLRRLGFSLEYLGCKNNTENIKKKIGKGYELLDPSMKKQNNPNKQWGLYINW
ncbi:hypothetical protein J4231_00670 [Candidatus Woesearchaeota archaeon]|nr:hypothetical protein [Candidatus Woesearchaeota archaeon]